MAAAPSLHKAYLLHSRPYRETSVILDLLSENEGRISVVARGARGPKSKIRGVLQLFSPILVSWTGKGELMNLISVESAGMPVFPPGASNLTGFYVNELITRLVNRHDPHPELFVLYEAVLHALAEGQDDETTLRLFELELLDALGYGFALDSDADGRSLQPGKMYRFVPERGLVASELGADESSWIYRAEELLAVAERDFSSLPVKRCAKRLMRRVLAHYLGDKPLASRELFRRHDA